MNQQKIEKEVRFLKIYAGVITILCGVFLLSAFAVSKNAKFDEIDVKRINVKDDDGKLRMVIANKDRQHPGVADGIPLERKRPTPGIIFFNEAGDEMGGLVIGNNGGKGHFGSFTFDKVKGDQTIGFRHLEGDDGKYSAGLAIWQQPYKPYSELKPKLDELRKITDKSARQAAYKKMLDNNEVMTDRLFIGKSRDDDKSLVSLSDIKGTPRLVLSVEPNGNPKLEFLDENGKVIYSLPENTAGKK